MRHTITFIGPLPPLYMGPSMATGIILNSSLKELFELVHLDTSDHRDPGTLARLDFVNVFLALRHYLRLFYMILIHWPGAVYVPISQTTMGYLRDSGFMLIAKLLNRRVVCHLRGGHFRNWLSSATPPKRRIVGFIHSRVDGQIVLGEKLRGLFADLLPSQRIHVVPNGGDYEVPPRPATGPVVRIVFLSNLHNDKGIRDSIEAIAELVTRSVRIPFRMDVYGPWRDTQTRQESLHVVRQRSLPVYFHCSVTGSEKMGALSRADLFVFPSFYPPEGHRWVIVEAMAAGLPIVITDQGAITESVIDGVNGFIVEKRNPAQIAERLKFLIENRDVRVKMGQASRRLYEERFTEARMVERLSAAICKVLEG